MEVTSLCNGCDITESSANKNPAQPECVLSQPSARGTPPEHPGEAPPPSSDRPGDGDVSHDPLLLLLRSSSSSALQTGVDGSATAPPPICTAPSSFTSPPPPPPPPPHHHPQTSQKRLSSPRSDATHIRDVAGDDSCAHCVLACLFCDPGCLGSAVGECMVVCSEDGAGCCDGTACCCAEAAGEAGCGDEACLALLDCGTSEDCCSTDCLEICLECCSICFPS